MSTCSPLTNHENVTKRQQHSNARIVTDVLRGFTISHALDGLVHSYVSDEM